MRFIYIDSKFSARRWKEIDNAEDITLKVIDELDNESVIFIHSSDWPDVINAQETYEYGALREAIKAGKGVCQSQIVFFSGDAQLMMKYAGDIKNALVRWGHKGVTHFVDHNVESAPSSFGAFVGLSRTQTGVLLAQDVMSEEREVLNVSFELLLAAYLLGSLPAEDVPMRFSRVALALKDAHLKFDEIFWAPVLLNGALDPRLSLCLQAEGLMCLKRHNCSEEMLASPALRQLLVCWLKKLEERAVQVM